MALWLAILVTVVASTSCSIGKALQKEGTRHLPRLNFSERKILKQYLLSRVWLAGLVADVGGGALQVAAFALAPVSVVQPVSGVGLVGLSLYSHFFLRERLQLLEWVAVALAGAGTIGLGATGGDDSGGADGAAAAGVPPPNALRTVGVLAGLAAAVVCVSLLRTRFRHRQRRSTVGGKSSAAGYGLQAGACFGLSAASCRTGFLLAPRQRLWPLLGLGGSIALSGYGFVLQTVGLKEGNTVVVCTLAAVSAMVSGVAVGLLALGETLAPSVDAAMLRVASWAAILVGVAALAGGAGAAGQLAAWALAQLPPGAWKLLPLRWAVPLKTWAAEGGGRSSKEALAEGELPQHHLHVAHAASL